MGLSYRFVKREPGNHCIVFRSFVHHGLVLTAVSRASTAAAAREQGRQLWSVHCEMAPKEQGQSFETLRSAIRLATPAQTLGGVQDFHAQ